jgi:hypothetical protein
MRVDGQVIAHRGALDRAAHAADVDRLAVTVAPGGGESDLVRAQCGEIALHGQAARHAMAV